MRCELLISCCLSLLKEITIMSSELRKYYDNRPQNIHYAHFIKNVVNNYLLLSSHALASNGKKKPLKKLNVTPV